MNEYLHIVCLDAPSPPDYGGAIDMYYKIKSLAAAGRKIILHYFSYQGNRDTSGLELYCTEINAYDRKGFISSLSYSTPYIVSSRINKNLTERLNQDDYPVLLEGIHCTGFIGALHPSRKVVVRMHNDEAAYYKRLSVTENKVLRKLYMKHESTLLKKYTRTLPRNIPLAVLSTTDQEVFSTAYQFSNVNFIPCFIPWQSITSAEGNGKFCLYHGNMQVSENAEAAAWLLKHVFNEVTIPFVIAGKGVPREIKSLCASYKHVRVADNPSIDQLNQMVRDAHIHVLPSLNHTGVKLKLLHSIFSGRFCITNHNGLAGSGILSGAVLADGAAEWKQVITELFDQSFSATEIKNRQQLLTVYNNAQNARVLSALL